MIWAIIIGSIVGVILLIVAMHYINRSYRINYNLNLIVGGLAMILAEAAIGLGVFLLIDSDNVMAYIPIGVGALLILIRLIMNIKKCGAGMGILALFLQLIFSVACLFLVFEFFSDKRHTIRTNYRNERYIREERARRAGERETEYDRRRNNRY